MTLLNELIEIPEQLDESQFVIKLTEGVSDGKETVDNYVVTKDIAARFEEALGYIKMSMDDGKSRACYLHGSFGSGKSHFMAILHLLLTGDTHARGINELAGTITKHCTWMDGKKFLLVPYHMIGSNSSETGILGGYAKYISKIHPEAPIPGVYRAQDMFADAIKLRDKIGEVPFYKGINDGVSAGGGFGNVTRTWDNDRLEKAMLLKEGEEERSLLISALSKAYFSSYGVQVENETKKFVDLEDGLAIMCQHAKSLKYDGVILFLDELILWLSGKANNLDFITQECAKLVQLVETENLGERPIPLISFIARQRDLNELVGENVPGAAKYNYNTLLNHNSQRFHTITLPDSNLPAIAERRVLSCKNASAQKELHASFEKLAEDGKNKHAVEALMTGGYDKGMFRKIYPFSPALVQTLIAVSSLLQRERTALKVMKHLLVEKRGELKVGDLIPVGDLFDMVAYGEGGFSTEMKEHFENAKKLYSRKLLPELEKKHKITLEQYKELPVDDPARRRFQNDDRLAKTLLLSALVPDVEALRGLTARRLAYLNHGTIKVVNPGEEGAMVLQKIRDWAKMIGAIKIGDGADPMITVQLSSVDTDSIIAKAERVDNNGNRQRLVRQTLTELLNLGEENTLQRCHFYDWKWKNTDRECIVVFQNVWELSMSDIRNEDDRWKIIIDYPFDHSDRGPMDDISKLNEFREANKEGTKTIAWLPSFFSDEASRDLGLLVRLNHILSGDQFDNYVGHLSMQDRPAARASLDSQRNVLKERLRGHLEAVYGLATNAESLHPTHHLNQGEQFASLTNGLNVRPPAKPNFQEALEQILDQALCHEFPGAPEFEAPVTSGAANKVFDYVSRACQTKDNRVEVEQRDRPLVRGIVNPLNLGQLGHDRTHLVVGDEWKNHFIKKASADGGELTVEKLKAWIDEPQKKGLPKYLNNLLVIAYALQSDQAFYQHGSVYSEPSLKDLPNCELRPEAKPAADKWLSSRDLASFIFGVTASELNSAANAAKLAEEVKKVVSENAANVESYRTQVSSALTKLGVGPDQSKRMQTANACVSLFSQIQSNSSGNDIVNAIADFSIPTTKEAMGECCKGGGGLADFLKGFEFGWFENIKALAGNKKTEADNVLAEVKLALSEDEHVKPLRSTFEAAESTAVRLLRPDDPAPQPEPGPEPQPPAPPGVQIVDRGNSSRIDVAEVETLLGSLKSNLKPNQKIKLDVSWTIEEESGE
ncbi:DUF6079 family protein [Mariniblastus fucicola]|uniref:Phage resistance protein n=1 Tax=Mariniblastus fucicola TaxID=980251 RepID=A0A5B9PHJ3_9BACT|nr:DUF6079 family protein [Mariniblastus fucicola]QEG24770.1 hypothetical protein MFFC18_46930 [Mariniblastus fucicola]